MLWKTESGSASSLRWARRKTTSGAKNASVPAAELRQRQKARLAKREVAKGSQALRGRRNAKVANDEVARSRDHHILCLEVAVGEVSAVENLVHGVSAEQGTRGLTHSDSFEVCSRNLMSFAIGLGPLAARSCATVLGKSLAVNE